MTMKQELMEKEGLDKWSAAYVVKERRDTKLKGIAMVSAVVLLTIAILLAFGNLVSLGW